jgi:pyruvate dehydrogenase E2 component (dihydrolipoamide acetyltransferase)
VTDVRTPRHLDSPRIRRLAREQQVDLQGVRRSGLHGRATAADIAAAVAPPGPPSTIPASTLAPISTLPPTPAPSDAVATHGRVERMSRRRRIVADRMLESLRVSAQLTTVVEVDLSRVSRVRAQSKDEFRHRHQAPLTVLAFVAEAAVRALGSSPSVNARLDLDAGTVTYPPAVHLGVAVDTDEGLLVPVVRNADDLSVVGLARRIADAADRSRRGAITADELSGGTFTITNTGSRGALFDTPIINQPQSAILGFGAIVRRPVVVPDASGEEVIAIRSMAYLALTYDHRLVDGADAARYLGTVKDRLERWDVTDPVVALAQEARA